MDSSSSHDRNKMILLHPGGAQRTSQPVRPLIQLQIRQLHMPVLYRNLLRRTRGLLLEQAVNRLPLREA
ncbi:hypothetical protein D3C80_1781290 [compost metagenome]